MRTASTSSSIRFSGKHDLNAYLALLKRNGTMTLVGAPPEPVPLEAFIGEIEKTQEMPDFCAEHGITCDIEMIPIDKISEAYERMLKSDVKYRFVIEMASPN